MLSVNGVSAYVQRYLNRMYLPTHARYGPMVLGAWLAFFLPGDAPPAKATTLAAGAATRQHAVPAWYAAGVAARVTAQCIAVVVILAVYLQLGSGRGPVPDAVHLAVTVALRNIFALAVAVLLYTALAPAGTPSHSSALAAALSWHGFTGIAIASYGINMFHARILTELAFRLPSTGLDTARWVFVLCIWALAVAMSYALSFTFQRHLEGPMRTALEQMAGVGREVPSPVGPVSAKAKSS